MITINRADLEDIANPELQAQALLSQIPELTLPVPVREIAAALDILDIKPLTTTGFEGGLITPEDKSEGYRLRGCTI